MAVNPKAASDIITKWRAQCQGLNLALCFWPHTIFLAQLSIVCLLSICLSVYTSVYVSMPTVYCLFFYNLCIFLLFVYHLPVYISMYCLSIHYLSVCLPIHLSVCLSSFWGGFLFTMIEGLLMLSQTEGVSLWEPPFP